MPGVAAPGCGLPGTSAPLRFTCASKSSRSALPPLLLTTFVTTRSVAGMSSTVIVHVTFWPSASVTDPAALHAPEPVGA